jgi:CRP/FNR family transcriptional regulator, anaerobic regulatory protein
MTPAPEECRTCTLFFRSGYFCAQLGSDELRALNKCSRTLTFKRGQTLDGLMLRTWPILAISSGVVAIKHLLDDGRSTIAAFFMEGDIIDLRRRSKRMRGSLIALTKTELCRLSPEVFENIIAINPDARRIAWGNLREQTIRSMDHSVDLGKKQVLEKLASFVFECRQRQPNGSSPGLIVSIPLRRCDVAEYLGLQPETVSRGFRELEARNIVRFKSTSVLEIMRLPDLKRIASGGQADDRMVRSNGADEKTLGVQ